MSSYATQMWWLMMIGFTLGSLITLFAARILLPRLKDLKSYDDPAESGERT